jgi:regulatory protein
MKSCHDYAVEYISRYPKTEKELRIKLYQKGYDSDDVDRTIEVLKKKKYVDDHMFAEMYVRSDVVKKGKPSLALRKKLEMKGIDVATLNDVFNENQVEMQEGIDAKIKKDIEQYKSK